MFRLPKIILGLILPIQLGCLGCNGLASANPRALKSAAIQRLRNSVNSHSLLVRMRAIESCVDLRLSNAPDICTKAIASQVPPLQFAGAMGLIEMPTLSAEPALRKLLSSSDVSVRLAAAGALHKLSNTEPSSQIAAALSDPDPTTRGNALMILGRLGEQSVITTLRPMLESESVERVRLQVAEALVLLGDEKVLPQLQLWQYSTNYQERAFAVQLMGQVKDQDLFVADLLQALNDPNQLVQLQAARSLGRLGQQDGYTLAYRYLHPSREDRQAIAQSVAIASDDPQLYQIIIQVRSLAALALGEIGNWNAAEPLHRALEEQDAQLSLSVAHGSLRLLQKTRKAEMGTALP